MRLVPENTAVAKVHLPKKPLTSMSAILFFRLALLFPLAIPLLAFCAGENELTNLLVLSLKFGGVQYLLFAGFLYYQIGRLKEPKRIRRLLYWTPVLFIPVQATPIMLLLPALSFTALETAAVAALVFSPFILTIGYGYVVVVDAIYTACFVILVKRPD